MQSATRFVVLALVVSACAVTPEESAPASHASPLAFVLTNGALTAHLEAQSLGASLRDGVLRVTTPSAALALETTTVGCDSARAGIGDAQADGARVELARGGATEWFVNGENGIEQGFTFAERPRCPSGELSIALHVAGGLLPRLESDTRVLFSTEDGVAQLAYSALAVRDADDRAIPAHFALEGDRIRIIVDDHDARYPLVVDPLITNEQVRLNASDGLADDQLGFASAVSGDTLVVGAPQVGTTDSGAVYVFVRSGTTWTQQARLVVAGSDHLGYSVAIDGDTIVAGSPFEASFTGNAYVFTRTGTTWTQEAALGGSTFEHAFGWGVGVHGNTAVVGAPGQGGSVGTAYVFTRVGIVWTRTDTLAPQTNANPGMKFGYTVAFDGNTILLGAPFSNEGGVITGCAYAFGLDSCFVASWHEEARITETGASTSSRVGDSVAVSNGTALVGASGHTFVNSRGAVWAHTRVDPGGAACPTRTITWPLQQQLGASDAADNDRFGASIALLDDRAVIGATGVLNGGVMFGGAGYYFTRTGTVWTERTKLIPTDAGANATGSSAAIGDTFSVLGANAAPRSTGVRSGGAYVFDTSHAPNGSTCSASTDCASGFCVDGYCCNVACGGAATTDCQACSVAAGATLNGTCHALATGHTCDDASMCTTGDTCSAAGACGGTTSCAPSDGCHTAACDPSTGACTQTVVANGVTCSDGNGCTTGDSCQAGVCTAGAPRVCTASDQCHTAGICDTTSGTCSNPMMANGVTCDDASACTMTDTCQAGVCVGASPVVCTALDMCHSVGTCNASTGICSMPMLGNGTACDDGDGCTTSDVCTAGVCGGAARVCTAGPCQTAGSCVSGACTAPTPLADGTMCPMGMCAAGDCVFPDGGAMPDAGNDAGNDAGSDAGLDASVDAGPDVDAASGADVGSTVDTGVVRDAGGDSGRGDGSIDASPDGGSVSPPASGGCGCAVPAQGGSSAGGLLGLALIAIVIARRRRHV